VSPADEVAGAAVALVDGVAHAVAGESQAPISSGRSGRITCTRLPSIFGTQCGLRGDLSAVPRGDVTTATISSAPRAASS
jgi:hypothetical protein